MSREKQIEEMANVLDACPNIVAPIGCDQHEGSVAIAEYLYNAIEALFDSRIAELKKKYTEEGK